MTPGGNALGINSPFARLAAQKLNRPRTIVQRLRQRAGLGEPIIARGHRNAARVKGADHGRTQPPFIAHAKSTTMKKNVQRPRPLAGRLEKIQPMPRVRAVGHIGKRGRRVDGSPLPIFAEHPQHAQLLRPPRLGGGAANLKHRNRNGRQKQNPFTKIHAAI